MASSYKFLVATVKVLAKNCIGDIGQIHKDRDFRRFGKSAPSKIENHVEISMFSYDMVNRPTSRDLNPIFDTECSPCVRFLQEKQAAIGTRASFQKSNSFPRERIVFGKTRLGAYRSRNFFQKSNAGRKFSIRKTILVLKNREPENRSRPAWKPEPARGANATSGKS